MGGTTYTPAQVAQMVGVSLAGIRNYCQRYSEFFSPGAVPPKGQPREFTADDVRLVQFIRDRTGAKQPQQHDQIVQALRAGELADYHPAADAAAVDEDAESMSRDILLAPQIAALQIVLKDYSLREAALQQRIDQTAQAAAERERALQAEIASLQRELGRVEGELSTIKSRRPWWQFWRQGSP